MSAAKSAPGFFADALSKAPDFAQHVPRHVADAAKQVPQAASSAWESLVTALQRSSQLAGATLRQGQVCSACGHRGDRVHFLWLRMHDLS